MKLKSGVLPQILALILVTGSGIGATVGNDESTADPRGTWRVVNRSDKSSQLSFEYTLTLNMNAGKLIGTLSEVNAVSKSRLYQWEIKEIKLNGSEISFVVTHPFDIGRGVITWSYKGRITTDTMKGRVTKETLGETRAGNWSAERVKE